MGLFKDLEPGARLELDFPLNGALGIARTCITVTVLYKRGRFSRLLIEAPENVTIAVIPPDGVMIPANRTNSPES